MPNATGSGIPAGQATSPDVHDMTNPIAAVLGVLILIALAVDVMLYGAENLLFLARKLAELIEWLAFWR